MVDEDNLDVGQSAFWETQASVQAPPVDPQTPETKRKRLYILAGVSFVFLLLMVVIFLPKRSAFRPEPTPEVMASPTPKPLQDAIAKQFNDIDQKLKDANSETMIAPPQVDMQVEF